MRQILPPAWKQKIRNFFLDLDARIDSTLFSSGKGARELYERYSTFMDRFYVGRWKRWVFIEPLSEAATIGLAGSILMLALAVPAFRETADEGLAEEVGSGGDLSRSLRQSDRQPRHQAQRLDPAGRLSGRADQGDPGDRRPVASTSISASTFPDWRARWSPTRRLEASARAVPRSRSNWRKTCS